MLLHTTHRLRAALAGGEESLNTSPNCATAGLRGVSQFTYSITHLIIRAR